MNQRTCALLFALLLGGSADSEAGDLAVVTGHGDGVHSVALGIRTASWVTGQFKDRWFYDVAGESQLARWAAASETDGISTVLDGSFTAVLTLRPAVLRRAYLEGGFGLHLLSEDHIAERDFGGHFQFGEFVGVGFTIGKQLTIGLRVHHVSNGSLRSENDGVTFVQGLVRCSF